jgi:hypothetical protein
MVWINFRRGDNGVLDVWVGVGRLFGMDEDCLAWTKIVQHGRSREMGDSDVWVLNGNQVRRASASPRPESFTAF